jgi:hypothetical protein
MQGCGVVPTWAGILIPTSTATVRNPTRAKKSDCAWQPANLRDGRKPTWPSIIVEVVGTGLEQD